MNDLTPDDILWLKVLANEIKTQKNRATAQPYYYCVRQEKPIVGMDTSCSGETVFVDHGGDYQEFETEEKAIASFIKDGLNPEEAQKYFDDHCEEFGILELHEDRNVFLTYKGYLEHMKLNGHNYGVDPDKYSAEADGKKGSKVWSYVQHAGRNPEMTRLIQIILKFGD